MSAPNTQAADGPTLAASAGSADWRSIADELAAALERLDALHRSEQDADAPTNRPEWLRGPWQRYWNAAAQSPNSGMNDGQSQYPTGTTQPNPRQSQ